ncbi:MAG: choice-of-anchor Q domain-containing protein, partial [Planctomycetota bacterium]
ASPCIDKGNSSYIPGEITTDIDGRTRIKGNNVDIGAYEGAWLIVPLIYNTIQSAIDSANSGDIVVVTNGTYKGSGNKNIDFGGKSIYLTSIGGAQSCIIDCENSGRGFYFRRGETHEAVIEGFTIQNASISYGGGIRCDSSSPTIIKCIIKNNTVTSSGAGIYCTQNSNPLIINCMIVNNSASYSGGGLYCSESNVTLFNCNISDNRVTTSGGAGLCVYSSTNVTVTNCTITNNTTGGRGGGLTSYESTTNLYNTIIWANSASIGKQINTWDSNSTVNLYNCDYANNLLDMLNISGLGEFTPVSCINSDPRFVNQWSNGDYHLRSSSPCIDAGNNSFITNISTLLGDIPVVDLDDNPRIINGIVDIGAYEYSSQ